MLYNILPDDYEIIDINGNNVNATADGDTILIWHNEMNNDSSFYFINYDERQDTILNKRSRVSMTEEKLTLAKSQKKDISFYQADSIRIDFNHYLKASDSLNISLSDSMGIYPIAEYKYDAQSLILKYDSLQIDSVYDLTLYPNSVEDIYGLQMQDTTSLKVTIKDPGELGNLNINVINVDTKSYSVHVLLSNDVINKIAVKKDTSFQVNRLEPGKYSLRVIEDLVEDNKWTPGDVILKRQSERLKEVPLEELRAGWDINFTLDINQVFDGVKSQ